MAKVGYDFSGFGSAVLAAATKGFAAATVSKRASYGKTVSLAKADFATAKIPAQAKGVLACLAANGGKLALPALVEKLGGFITTKQTPERIFAFYRKALIDDGYIACV